MGFLVYLKDIFTVASILSLLVIGLMISLKSGVVSVGGDRCRLIWSNLSRLVFTLAGVMLALVMIQQMVGMRMGFR